MLTYLENQSSHQTENVMIKTHYVTAYMIFHPYAKEKLIKMNINYYLIHKQRKVHGD